MGAGKVDYDNLWKNAQYRLRRIRWRVLRSRVNGVMIRVFGYACNPDGPWFGFPEGSLVDAVCAHCKQPNVFANEADWDHVCPGKHNGVLLPCQEDHACRGEPNMVTAPMWRIRDWMELEV